MYRLTKKEKRERIQVEEWLRGDRDLEPDFVKENYMPNCDPSELGEFYTPLEMASFAASLVVWENGIILDPCAGIGTLLEPFAGYERTAFELSNEPCKVANRLYPDLNCEHADVFDRLHQIEGKYDYVVMNPPFGASVGQMKAMEICQSGATLSQHTFLELAVRALVYGGEAIILGPYNLIDRIPKGAKKWFENNMEVVGQHDNLPGQFKLTKVTVSAFVVTRISRPVVLTDHISVTTEPIANMPLSSFKREFKQEKPILKQLSLF